MINRETIFKRITKIDEKLFISKVLDKAEKCEKIGKLIHTDFIDPHQNKLIQSILPEVRGLNYILNGGFDGAERVVLFFCPDFIIVEDFNISEAFTVLSIDLKSKESLTHRDFLGSLMGLGIKREKIGDIIIKEDGCHLIVLSEIADFIIYNLLKVGNSKVVIEKVSLDDINVTEKEVEEISSTVASLRLDCIASASFGISRTKVVDYIKSDKVNLNWVTTDDPTKIVKQGDTISLRGKGRVVLVEVGRVTKKGRIGIILKKNI